ncbi:4a-hydroxytetrahydrobiopterin dehydratase [Streptomyces sp. XM4193]|uniref:4a-hydroxytetrahydrobiopterin dehydratase n=1 Tax=Streptomyces sp. XM4193 TaxID=2929782 RepID=UPI001FF83C46|nr:4a-hydroxytetrahydrobiopterin dehydratase [Streptomyces sp. XM4193]MCK1794943.1 4a-hydroxytetrahydrobiopterin dehydratase [Streptomyces sp. XM4193]
MAATPLTDVEITNALAELPGWSFEDNALTAGFKADRTLLPQLYVAVAAAEDDADHHARVTILYGTISFALNTHDAGDVVTAKDTAMAARISAIAADHQARPVG